MDIDLLLNRFLVLDIDLLLITVKANFIQEQQSIHFSCSKSGHYLIKKYEKALKASLIKEKTIEIIENASR